MKATKKIEQLLRKLGVNLTYAGYKITISAVELTMENPDVLTSVTKELYPACAKLHNVSYYSVERNIRTVVRKAWERNRELLLEIAGYPLTSPPSAREFIEMLASEVEAR